MQSNKVTHKIIRELIAENRTDEAIEKIKELIDEDDHKLQNEWTLLKRQFSQLDSDITTGQIQGEKAKLEANKLNKRVLGLLKKIPIKQQAEIKAIPKALHNQAKWSTLAPNQKRLLTSMGALLLFCLLYFGFIRQNTDLNGEWNITFFFKEGNDPAYIAGRLESYYDFDINQKGKKVRGTGSKHSQTFNGRFSAYTFRFPCVLAAEIKGKKLIGEIYVFNKDKNTISTERVNVNISSRKELYGVFDMDARDSKGEVKMVRK